MKVQLLPLMMLATLVVTPAAFAEDATTNLTKEVFFAKVLERHPDASAERLEARWNRRLNVRERAQKIHETYPDLNRKQVKSAATHPRKARFSNTIHEEYPNATKKQIRRAVNHPKVAQRAHKIHETYPDLNKKQVRWATKHPVKAKRLHHNYQNHQPVAAG